VKNEKIECRRKTRIERNPCWRDHVDQQSILERRWLFMMDAGVRVAFIQFEALRDNGDCQAHDLKNDG